MPVDLDTGILAPLLVVFVGAAAFASGKVYLLSNEKKSLKRKITELEKQLVASEEHRKEHLNIALDRYREQIERQQKEVGEISRLDSEWRFIVSHLVEELDRLEPGWSSTHKIGPPDPRNPLDCIE